MWEVPSIKSMFEKREMTGEDRRSSKQRVAAKNRGDARPKVSYIRATVEKTSGSGEAFLTNSRAG